MTWTRDGSGLDVKRVRGMTLPQCEAATWNRRSVDSPRESKRLSAGWLSDTSFAHKQRQRARQQRRERRAKRLAKAAARRETVVMLRQQSRNWAAAERWRCFWDPSWDAVAVRTCGSIGVITIDSPGVPTSEARTLFDQARQEADAAIARAVVGKSF